jgi:hypothetical protein
MNLIKKALITIMTFSILPVMVSCNRQSRKTSGLEQESETSHKLGDAVSDIGKNIYFMLQDKNDQYLFASNGEGVYCYDGSTILHLTEKDGLCSNFVRKIHDDSDRN